MRIIPILCLSCAVGLVSQAGAAVQLDRSELTLTIAAAQQLHASGGDAAMKWTSSDPSIAQVFQNGFVAGLKPGTATISAGGAQCAVTVTPDQRPLIDPATLKQFPDSRHFTANGRECYGSELNGRRTSSPEEHANTRSNRIINPKPLREDKPVDWKLTNSAEIYDGAGVLMGTVPADLKVGNRTVPVSMFNFGMSKVLNGRLCVYAFSTRIRPSPQVRKLIDPRELGRDGTVGTSAWLPIDCVVEKEALLERIGLGKVKLPRLPLEKTRYRITGGNPNQYMTPDGELGIVKAVDGPVPSHYLRRPSGTVNIIYSVPGFGLGGQGLDSFLVSDGVIFRPARGAKVFVQPTYYPKGNPRHGQVAPQTMTFVYGAVDVKGTDPIYGWVARESLAPG